MLTTVQRAANHVLSKFKAGWGKQAAFGSACQAYGVTGPEISAELRARKEAKKRAETINHSTPAPEIAPRPAQAPQPAGLFDDAPAQNGYGML